MIMKESNDALEYVGKHIVTSDGILGTINNSKINTQYGESYETIVSWTIEIKTSKSTILKKYKLPKEHPNNLLDYFKLHETFNPRYGEDIINVGDTIIIIDENFCNKPIYGNAPLEIVKNHTKIEPGMIGTVVCIASTGSIGIEMPIDVNGHTCHNKCYKGRGIYLNPTAVKKLKYAKDFKPRQKAEFFHLDSDSTFRIMPVYNIKNDKPKCPICNMEDAILNTPNIGNISTDKIIDSAKKLLEDKKEKTKIIDPNKNEPIIKLKPKKIDNIKILKGTMTHVRQIPKQYIEPIRLRFSERIGMRSRIKELNPTKIKLITSKKLLV